MAAEGGCSGLGATNDQPAEQLEEPEAMTRVAAVAGADLALPIVAGASRAGIVARTAWSFIGQGLSSSSNFILSVLVLSQGSRSDFATLSVVLTVYTFLVLLLRAAVGLPITLLYSKDLGKNAERDFEAAAGVTLAMSVVAAAVLVLSALVSPAYRGQLLVLAITLPLLLLQDTARYSFFALGQPRTAAMADGLWVLLQVLASVVVLILASEAPSTTALLAAWAGAGALSGCLLLRRTSFRPALGPACRWLRKHKGLSSRLVTDYLVGAGSHYAVFFALAVVAGSLELGRLKAAQTFLGPLIVVLLGGAVIGVPESVRADADPARLWRLTLRLAGSLVGASVTCGAIVYLALPIVGPGSFPDAWEGARSAIPLLTVFAGAVAASTGATSGLRAMAQNAWLLRVRLATGPLLVLGSIPASAFAGARGALAVLSVVEWTVAFLSWNRLRHVLARPDPDRSIR